MMWVTQAQDGTVTVRLVGADGAVLACFNFDSLATFRRAIAKK